MDKKMMICPKAKECVDPCGYEKPHIMDEDCENDNTLTGHTMGNNCPACIPYVASPKDKHCIAESRICMNDIDPELCEGCPDWREEQVEPQPEPSMPLKHTPLPWQACNDGKCSCKQIWCSDYPIAVVNSGDWGDDYPSIRIVGDSSLDLKAEAYMEQCTYGHIPEEEAEANIQFIVKACNSYDPTHDQQVRKAFAEECIKTFPTICCGCEGEERQRETTIAHLRAMAEGGR